LVFKVEMAGVYCAVRTESLNLNQVDLSLQKVKFQVRWHKIGLTILRNLCMEWGSRRPCYKRYCGRRAGDVDMVWGACSDILLGAAVDGMSQSVCCPLWWGFGLLPRPRYDQNTSWFP